MQLNRKISAEILLQSSKWLHIKVLYPTCKFALQQSKISQQTQSDVQTATATLPSEYKAVD